MSKRLQVVLQDPEYREIQRMARARRMTVAEWVRQALAFARHREPLGDAEKKISALRTAIRNEFPTSDIETMLSEIESGYGTEPRP
jgi:hypothetical protein